MLIENPGDLHHGVPDGSIKMFTSLRARLWLSYALVITVALGIVVIVLFLFIIRNPVLSRQAQERIRAAQGMITANPQEYVDDPNALESVTQSYDVRVLVYNSSRELLFDSHPDEPQLPFPRRNLLARNSQVATGFHC
jgi:hypothetical protein